MKINVRTIVALLILSIATPLSIGAEKETEVEGKWTLEKGGRGVPKNIQFTGNNFVISLADERVLKGTFKLNTKENPSWMDLKITSDTLEQTKGKNVLCIYKFEGEKLVWCASIPGRKRRPPQFANVMGDARLLLGTYKFEKE